RSIQRRPHYRCGGFDATPFGWRLTWPFDLRRCCTCLGNAPPLPRGTLLAVPPGILLLLCRLVAALQSKPRDAAFMPRRQHCKPRRRQRNRPALDGIYGDNIQVLAEPT